VAPGNAIPSAKSVFLNHPYDERYVPLADALVFAVVCCGFVPRSARESGTVAVPRMERIVGALRASRYSIHDLSRWNRFNLPLELGIAMALRHLRAERRDAHDWLLLVAGGRSFRRFVSDLAGFDPEVHDQTAETLVPKVIAWLANRTPLRTPTPQTVLAKLPAFQAAKRCLAAEWKGAVPWRHLLAAAEEVAKEV